MCDRDRERYEKQLREIKDGTWDGEGKLDSQKKLRDELDTKNGCEEIEECCMREDSGHEVAR